MKEDKKYGPIEISDGAAIRIAGYLLLDESRWNDMYGYDRMPDSYLLDDLSTKVRSTVKAVKRILDEKDTVATRIRHHAFANEIHRALENAVETISDVRRSSYFRDDLMKEHSVAKNLIREIMSGEQFLTEFDKMLELDEDAFESIDDCARDSYLEKVSRARRMVDDLLTTHEYCSISGHIDDNHREIQNIVNTIRKYGSHTDCMVMGGLPLTDSKIANIMSYRKKMTDAFRRSIASPEQVTRFEELMGSDDKLIKMAERAKRLEADGDVDWSRALKRYSIANHISAVNYATDVLCS